MVVGNDSKEEDDNFSSGLGLSWAEKRKERKREKGEMG